jgi:hypothetical protein
MFMPKQPVSVTLDRDNLLWLRGRMAGRKRRSLSDALDEVITAARLGGPGANAIRSVVGTIDIASDDRLLDRADAYVRSEFERSLARPRLARESGPAPTPGRGRRVKLARAPRRG